MNRLLDVVPRRSALDADHRRLLVEPDAVETAHVEHQCVRRERLPAHTVTHAGGRHPQPLLRAKASAFRTSSICRTWTMPRIGVRLRQLASLMVPPRCAHGSAPASSGAVSAGERRWPQVRLVDSPSARSGRRVIRRGAPDRPPAPPRPAGPARCAASGAALNPLSSHRGARSMRRCSSAVHRLAQRPHSHAQHQPLHRRIDQDRLAALRSRGGETRRYSAPGQRADRTARRCRQCL